LEQLEFALRRIRSKSTADIVIQTSNPNISGQMNADRIQELRALANKYNCELIDAYRAFQQEMTISGNPLSYYLNDSTHPNAYGHQIYYKEFIQHFDTTGVYKYYSPNPFYDVETFIEVEEPLIAQDTTAVKLYGNWTLFPEYLSSFTSLQSTAADDSIVITFEGVGFEFGYQNTTSTLNEYATADIYVDGVKPSAIRNPWALEYVPDPSWDLENAEAAGVYRLFKVFALDTVTLRDYEVNVVDAANDSFLLGGVGFNTPDTTLSENRLLTNTSFETYTGTIDDGVSDTFTGWANGGNGTVEAVSSAYSGSVCLKIARSSTALTTCRQAPIPCISMIRRTLTDGWKGK
jgi:hypothetical protein